MTRDRCKPYPAVDLCAMADEWSVDYWRLRFMLDGFERVRHCRLPKGRAVFTLPIRPLLQGRTVTGLADESDTPRASVLRWGRNGAIPYRAAIEICDALRIHPTEVWGRQWHAATALVTEGVIK